MIKNLDYKKLKLVLMVLGVIFLISLMCLAFKETHAYYSYDSGWVPIFTGKVGDFSGGKLDHSTYESEGDINIIVYQSDGKTNHIIDKIPVSGIVLNREKSTCDQKDVTYTNYSIDRDGLLKLRVQEDIPNQITCRIVYELISDVIVYAYMQDPSGTESYGGITYTLVDKIPEGYSYSGYRCSNEDIKTDLGYDETKGFHFKTEGPNTCYAYFAK